MMVFSIVMLLAFGWLLYETDWMRVRLPYGSSAITLLSTELERIGNELTHTADSIQRAKLEAYQAILQSISFAQGDNDLALELIQDAMWDRYSELGNRSLPFHGGSNNLFPEYHKAELNAQVNILSEFLESVR